MQQTKTTHVAGPERRGLLALLRALVDSGVDLAHNTAQMAASESRIVLHRAMVRLGLFVAALFVATMGLLLALVGVALLLVRVSGVQPWIAFVLVGVATSAAGTAWAVRAMRRFSEPDLAFPATLAEFKADIEMLRSGRAHVEDEAA